MTTVAMFSDAAFMSIEKWPTEAEARAFVTGCAHAAKLYEREMTGYVMPTEIDLMRANEDATEADRAVDAYLGTK